jgi:hypothetical protein
MGITGEGVLRLRVPYRKASMRETSLTPEQESAAQTAVLKMRETRTPEQLERQESAMQAAVLKLLRRRHPDLVWEIVPLSRECRSARNPLARVGERGDPLFPPTGQ